MLSVTKWQPNIVISGNEARRDVPRENTQTSMIEWSDQKVEESEVAGRFGRFFVDFAGSG